jgi:hypothetical protein
MIYKISFFILFFSSFTTFAQTNFEEALVIINTGDTLTGFIDNRDWRKNPKVIVYRDRKNAIKEYSPLDIQGFYLVNTNEWYRSAVLELNKNSIKESDVIKNRNQWGTQVDTVFMRLLVKGKISLYYLIDESSRPHYIVEKNNQINELRIERKRVSYPKEGIVNLDFFRSQLNEYFSDCQSGKFSVSDAKYTESSLKPLVIKYNECFSSEGSYIKTTEKITTSISIIAGVNYSKLTVNGDSYSSGDKNYKPDFSPFAGISFDFILPRNRKSLSFNNELIYRYYTIDEMMKTSQLKLTTALRYRFPSSSNNRFFLGAGFTNALTLSTQSLLAGGYSGREFRKYEQGLAFETGVLTKRWTYLLRVERTNGFSPYSATNTKFTLLYAGIAYKLNK